ncbi:MAG: hypothetical protein VB031_02010 [Eubacteriaceae bacterium]|nr:hypothetical protein [Eubacteriaceae bacterium]
MNNYKKNVKMNIVAVIVAVTMIFAVPINSFAGESGSDSTAGSNEQTQQTEQADQTQTAEQTESAGEAAGSDDSSTDNDPGQTTGVEKSGKAASTKSPEKPWMLSSNSTSYATLTEAYAAAEATDTITLDAGVTVTEKAAFSSEKDITLTSDANNPGVVTRALDTINIITVTKGDLTLNNIIFRATAEEKNDKAGCGKRGPAIHFNTSNGTLNIQDGTVIEDFYAGQSSVAGAGVRIGQRYSGNLLVFAKCVMTGGKIRNNMEGNNQHGGGIAIDWGEFHISGGEITGNGCGSTSGEVFFDADVSSIYLSGNPVIKNNTGGNNSYICDLPIMNRGVGNKATKVYMGKLTEGAEIGIYQRNGHVDNGYVAKVDTGIDASVAEDNLKYFFDDMAPAGLAMIAKDGYILFEKAKIWRVESTGTKYETLQEAYNNAAVTDTITLLDETYEDSFTDGKHAEGAATFSAGKNITLTSEKDTIKITRKTNTAALLNIDTGDTVTMDKMNFGSADKETAGTKSGIVNNGTLTLNKCTVAGFKSESGAGGINNGGTLNVNSGASVTNNTGVTGGIFNTAGSSVINLNGGSITGNTGTASGGVAGTGEINVKGKPVISGNTGNNVTKNVTLAGTQTVKLTGALETGADVGVYSEDHHQSGETIASGSEADAAASAEFFKDDYAAKIEIIHDEDNKANIVFASKKIWKNNTTDKKYSSLQAAYDAATSGDTIMLLDTTCSEYLTDGAWAESAAAFDKGKKLTVTTESGSGNVVRSDMSASLITINNANEDITFKNIVFGPTTAEAAGSKYLADVEAGKLTVEEGTAVKNMKGQGVFCTKGEVVINGGTFTGNNEDSGIFAGESGKVTINDGTFKKNTGIYAGVMFFNGDVSINGGEFTENSGFLGAVVCLRSVKMSGDPVIKNNTATQFNGDCNVYIADSGRNIILTGALKEGADVGVYVKSDHAVGKAFASGSSADYAAASSKYFKDDYTNKLRIVSSGKDVIFDGPAIWKVSSTGTDYSTLQLAYDNAAKTDTVTLLDVDNTTDITDKTVSEAPVTFAGGKNITLTSQSKQGSIVRKDKTKSLIAVNGSGDQLTIKEFNIGGAAAEAGESGNKGYGVEITAGKAVLQSGAAIRGINSNGNAGAGLGISGTGEFVLDGGTIEKNNGAYGGGVYVIGGKFTMNSGYIKDNTSAVFGAVCEMTNTSAQSASLVTINGGTITGNVSGRGAVGSLGGSFIMSGAPVITGNTDTSGKDANVYLFGNAKIYLSGALTDGAQVGVTSVSYHKGGGIIAVNGSTGSDASVVYPGVKCFSDDLTPELVIVQDVNNTKNIIFSAASLEGHNVVIRKSEAAALTSAGLVSKAEATATDNNGNDQAITVSSSKLAEINNADAGDKITGVTLTTPYKTRDISVLIVDDETSVTSDSSGYLRAEDMIITSSAAATAFGSFSSADAAKAKLIETNKVTGKLVAADLSTRDAEIIMYMNADSYAGLKTGTVGSYAVLYGVKSDSGKLATKTVKITVVDNDSGISSDGKYAITASDYTMKLAEANALTLSSSGKCTWLDNKTDPFVTKADGTTVDYTSIDTVKFKELQGASVAKAFDYTYEYKIDATETISRPVKINVTEDGSHTAIQAMPAILTTDEAKVLNAAAAKDLYKTNSVEVYTGVTDTGKTKVDLDDTANKEKLGGEMTHADLTALNNGTEGLYPVKYKYFYNGTSASTEFKEADTNIAVVPNGAAISTDKTSAVVGGNSISMSSADAKTKITDTDALATLCDTVGYRISDTSTELVPVGHITVATDSLSEMMTGKPGVYKVTFSVGSKGNDNYAAKDVTVAIYDDDAATAEKDGATKAAVWGSDTILTEKQAKAMEKAGASVTDGALIKANSVQGFAYEYTENDYVTEAPKVSYAAGTAESIAAGTKGEYTVKYKMTDKSDASLSAEKALKIFVVSDEAVISTDKTDAVYAQDALIKVSDAKAMSDDSDLIKANKAEGIKDGATASAGDIGVVSSKDFNNINMGPGVLDEGVYDVKYTVGDAEKSVRLTVVSDDTVITGSSGISGRDYFIQKSDLPALTEGTFLEKGNVTGYDASGDTVKGNQTNAGRFAVDESDYSVLKAGSAGKTYGVETAYGTAKKMINVTVADSVAASQSNNETIAASNFKLTQKEAASVEKDRSTLSSANLDMLIAKAAAKAIDGNGAGVAVTKVTQLIKAQNGTYRVTFATAKGTEVSVVCTVSIPQKSILLLKGVNKTKKSQKLTWTKVNGADGYILYGNRCNQRKHKHKMKKIKVIRNGKTLTYTKKGIKKARKYKYKVYAYKISGGKKVIIAESPTIHLVSKGFKKYRNASKIKLSKTSVNVMMGSSVKIKAKVYPTKKLFYRDHCDKARYISSNSSIAVAKKGVITGRSTGTCTIYVIAPNGVRKSVKVTVK